LFIDLVEEFLSIYRFLAIACVYYCSTVSGEEETLSLGDLTHDKMVFLNGLIHPVFNCRPPYQPYNNYFWPLQI
jgi:hypothetical protein